LVSNVQSAGPHLAQWNGTDDSGRPLPAGCYFFRLEAKGLTATKRLVKLK